MPFRQESLRIGREVESGFRLSVRRHVLHPLRMHSGKWWQYYVSLSLSLVSSPKHVAILKRKSKTICAQKQQREQDNEGTHKVSANEARADRFRSTWQTTYSLSLFFKKRSRTKSQKKKSRLVFKEILLLLLSSSPEIGRQMSSPISASRMTNFFIQRSWRDHWKLTKGKRDTILRV